MPLVLPMGVLVLLTFTVLTLMFFARMKAIKQKEVKIGYMKIHRNKSDLEVPEKLIQYERHFTNLFEVPLIFYITCLVFIFFKLVDTSVIIMAWGFVLSRLAHTIVHLTSNSLIWRPMFYGLGCLIVLVMWMILLGKIYL